MVTQMENVYVPIDPDWSHHMIGGLKGFVDLDFRTQSHIYEQAMDYLRLQHNFVWNHRAPEFNQGYERLLIELQRYPIQTSYFEHYFKELYRRYQLAMNELKGEISQITTFSDDQGDITGIVCAVTRGLPCIQSVLNPILQMGIKPH